MIQSTRSGLTRSGLMQTMRLRDPIQIKSRLVAREFKSDDRPDLHAGTPPSEAFKSIISIAASHKDTFAVMHQKTLRDLCWYDHQWRTEWAPTLGKFAC